MGTVGFIHIDIGSIFLNGLYQLSTLGVQIWQLLVTIGNYDLFQTILRAKLLFISNNTLGQTMIYFKQYFLLLYFGSFYCYISDHFIVIFRVILLSIRSHIIVYPKAILLSIRKSYYCLSEAILLSYYCPFEIHHFYGYSPSLMLIFY